MSHEPRLFTAMISSTALDLPEHRAAVKEACIAARVFPIGMEHLPARDASGITASLEMVEKADIYLGIYAYRYGWVPDGRDVSITEMEFDHAVKLQAENKLREILIFTAHKQHPVTFDDVETGDIPQNKLAAFKTKAATGRVRKEFRSVEELRRLVSDALHEFLLREHANVQVTPEIKSPSANIVSNLPRLPHFFGREEELKRIKGALEASSGTWGALIDGEGGRGKTALAVRAAELCPPDQFSRIIFLSARQRVMDETGLRELGGFALQDWGNMRNEIGRRLDHPAIAKEPEVTRTHLLCQVLANSRSLIILDNLESLPEADIQDLRTFVENLPRDCKVLLTSRTSLGLTSERLPLPRLDVASALECLADLAIRNDRLAESSEADRIKLYAQTQGNPLLLRWVAGQVGQEDRTTLNDALAFLRTCPPDNDPLDYIFGDVLRSLSEAHVLVLAVLTYPDQPILVDAIAEISGVAVDDTRRVLKILANRSLVVPDKQQNSYALVPMVADFLRMYRPEVVRETGVRLGQRACELIVENGYRKYPRFPVLEAAWPTIAPALPIIMQGPNETLQRVWNALRTFLQFSGRWDEGLTLAREAEHKAFATNDFDNAGRRAIESCRIYYHRGLSSEILACADRADGYWKDRVVHPTDRAEVLRWRGDGYRLAHNYPAAIASFKEAVVIWRTIGPERIKMAHSINQLAATEHLAGDLDAAEGHYREALRIARFDRSYEGTAQFTSDLAALLLDRQDWHGAEALAREAVPLAENIRRQELIASNCARLAEALLRQGRAVEALPHAHRAVEIYTKLNSPNLAAAQATLRECQD